MDKDVAYKIENFFEKFKSQTFKKGEILIRADEDPSGIFYLKSGYVKQYSISPKGEELIVNIYRTPAFFPMSWAINDTHNAYYFQATTGVEVSKASKGEVLKFIKKEQDVLYDLLSRIFNGLDGLLVRMTYLMAGNAYLRLVAELIIQTKRFGHELKVSEKDLAAETGMSRETVSREMKILKNKGLVVFNKSLLKIVNLEKLENELTLF